MAGRALYIIILFRLAFPLCEPDIGRVSGNVVEDEPEMGGPITSLLEEQEDRWWGLLGLVDLPLCPVKVE